MFLMFKYHGLPPCHMYLTVPYLILGLQISSVIVLFLILYVDRRSLQLLTFLKTQPRVQLYL